MTKKLIKEKGILAKFLESAIKLLVIKECKRIGKIKIDIFATSIQIVQGILQKIDIAAEDINYNDLLFDKIKLEANNLKIKFKINNKELNFENNIIIKFKISLSENSLKKVLLLSSWKWIGDEISNKILNHEKLEDIKIKDDHIFLNTLKSNKVINKWEKVYIKTHDGKLFLENKLYEKSIKIPIEEKVSIKNVNIENDLINISATSTVDF